MFAVYYCQSCLLGIILSTLDVECLAIISFKCRNEERHDRFGEWIPFNLHAICYRGKETAGRESVECLTVRTFTPCLLPSYRLLSLTTLLIH